MTCDCLQQCTLSSAWNQKEKTQPSFVVQEVVCGLRKESIELETFQQAFNLWLWTVVVYQKVLTTGRAIFTDQCGSLRMFLVYLLYERKCLRTDLIKINCCLNICSFDYLVSLYVQLGNFWVTVRFMQSVHRASRTNVLFIVVPI